MDYHKITSMVAEIPKFLPHQGTQIGIENKIYAVGDICLLGGGMDWDRPLNATPDTHYWRALYFAALAQHNKSDCSVVVGAPYDLVQNFTNKVPTGNFTLLLPQNESKKITVECATVVPEGGMHAIAFSEMIDSECIVISNGFGTIEFGAATSEGVLDNSLYSLNYGVYKIIDPFLANLKAIGYDNPDIRADQFFYWDKIIQQVVDRDENIVLNYNKVQLMLEDLIEPVDKALTQYANNLVLRARPYFNRFTHKMKVIITGGGINHPPIKDKLGNLISDMKFEVYAATKDESTISGAKGAKIIAEEIYGKKGIGIDIGNNSVITITK
jgi:hypothetical protein